jgi:sulfite exporter TauE/SafE
MFAVGLATSVHCISMCGPMVVTYAVKGDEGDGWTKRVRANVAYQGAKLLSYLLVGLALGAIGSAFNLDGVRPWVMLAAGVFMIVIGLGMTGKVPWAARLTPRPPRALINAIGKLRRKATTDAAAGESTLATPIAFGLLTGLMPCAPLAAAEIAAASSGNVLTGGMIMVAFGLGTLPLLFAFGTASSLIPLRWKQRLTFVLAFVVIGLGLVFVNRTAMLIGFPVNSHTIQAAVTGTPATPIAAAPTTYTTGADGVVEVPLTVANGRYEPSALNIPAGKPVRLIVTRNETDPCSKQLVFPNLGIKKDLADNGVTTINLPATKTGTFTMTCGMGMISGSLIVGGGAPGGGGLPSWSWLVAAVAAIGGALWLALGLGQRRSPASQPGQAPAAPAAAATTPIRTTTGRTQKQRGSPSRPAPKGARR